jgi:hypothetical protein
MKIKLDGNKSIGRGGRWNDLQAPAGRHPRGSVLLYTIVILLLMTLMGAALMVNSRTELQISGNTAQGRDAFTKGDASARVGLLLGRAFLHPSSGEPRDYLNNDKTGDAGNKPFKVKLHDDIQTDNNLQQIAGSITMDQIRERYLSVTEADVDPHLTVEYGDQVVGTAFIGLGKNIPDLFDEGKAAAGGFALTGGGTLGDGSYNTGGSGESNIKVYLVISSQGRVPLESGKTYYDETYPSTHSIISTIFREVMP